MPSRNSPPPPPPTTSNGSARTKVTTSGSPAGWGDTAPCTVLHAWERGVRSARPRWSVRGEPWDIFQRALFDSLVVLSNHINGRPVSGVRWRKLRLTEDAYRCTMLWCWGGVSPSGPPPRPPR